MSDHLLTPDLRKKVEDVVKDCLAKAKAKYNEEFKMPEIWYNIKGTDGGMAYYQKWLIRLNLIFLIENEEHFLKTTVPHEVAHLVAHQVFDKKLGKTIKPHGKEWKEVMGVLGIPAKRCHNYSTASLDRHRVPRVRGIANVPLDDRRALQLVKAAKKLPSSHLKFVMSELQNLLENADE